MAYSIQNIIHFQKKVSNSRILSTHKGLKSRRHIHYFLPFYVVKLFQIKEFIKYKILQTIKSLSKEFLCMNWWKNQIKFVFKGPKKHSLLCFWLMLSQAYPWTKCGCSNSWKVTLMLWTAIDGACSMEHTFEGSNFQSCWNDRAMRQHRRSIHLRRECMMQSLIF